MRGQHGKISANLPSLVSTVHSLTISVFILEMGENIVGETAVSAVAEKLFW